MFHKAATATVVAMEQDHLTPYEDDPYEDELV